MRSLYDEEFNWDAFKEEHGTEIEKMQGNKDGKLYEYTKETLLGFRRMVSKQVWLVARKKSF